MENNNNISKSIPWMPIAAISLTSLVLIYNYMRGDNKNNIKQKKKLNNIIVDDIKNGECDEDSYNPLTSKNISNSLNLYLNKKAERRNIEKEPVSTFENLYNLYSNVDADGMDRTVKETPIKTSLNSNVRRKSFASVPVSPKAVMYDNTPKRLSTPLKYTKFQNSSRFSSEKQIKAFSTATTPRSSNIDPSSFYSPDSNDETSRRRHSFNNNTSINRKNMLPPPPLENLSQAHAAYRSRHASPIIPNNTVHPPINPLILGQSYN